MRYLLVLVLAIAMIACNKKINHTPQYYTRTCNTSPLNPYFPSQYYSLEDLDTIVVKKFSDDSSFSNLISESTYFADDLVHTNPFGYTPDGYSVKDLKLVFGYSYEISIVSIQQTYRLWEMSLSDSIDTYDGNPNNGHVGECYDYKHPGRVTGGKYSVGFFSPGYPGATGQAIRFEGQ